MVLSALPSGSSFERYEYSREALENGADKAMRSVAKETVDAQGCLRTVLSGESFCVLEQETFQ